MFRLLSWLSERKLLAAVTAGVYFVAVVVCHHEVSRIVEWMNATLSFKSTNRFMLEGSILLALLVLVPALISFRRGEHKLFQIALWLFTAILVVLCYRILIVVNVENIHFLQYALLTVPVFALVRRYGETVFWVTLLGALDEAYQYFVLYPHRQDFYFDFNDIVINLAGAGIGVAYIYTFLDVKAKPISFGSRPRREWYRSPVFLATAIISFGILTLYMTGLLKFYPSPEAADVPLVLSRIPAATTFWTEPKFGKPFHILNPLEGVISAGILMACYLLWDHLAATRNRT